MLLLLTLIVVVVILLSSSSSTEGFFQAHTHTQMSKQTKSNILTIVY